MAETEREDISIIDRTIVKEIGDRVEIEWQLNAKPELQWAEIFHMVEVPDRIGSLEWIRGGGPDVMGTVIRWFVPGGEIEHAESEVRHRLSVANRRFGPGREM